MAISTATNNAELMMQCRDLGYLHDDWRVLDPTHGCGRFWTHWKPRRLIACDLDLNRSPFGQAVDFRALPFPDRHFEAVVFDPPYKLNGTGGSHASDDSYGVATKGIRWQDKHATIRDGITECWRVLADGGYLLVKCQDQVCSGQVRWQTIEFTQHAVALGCRLVDMLHLPSYRPQPDGRRQVHARRNYSTLLVFTKDTP